jgi:DNA repair protein RecO
VSYHIYTTEGLVLSQRASGEADRIYSILTAEFGLVRAKAGGIRKEVSKLRAALEPLSFSIVSFVRGKEYWRITSAALEANLVNEFKDKKDFLVSLSQVLVLLEKLVVGESSHPELLSVIDEALNFARNNSLTKEETKLLEIWMVLRVLYELGYVSDDEITNNILTKAIDQEILGIIEENKKKIIEIINSGIRITGLIRDQRKFMKR